MKTLKISLLVTLSVIAVVFGSVGFARSLSEGKTVEWRVETINSSTIGHYPQLHQVIEDGWDNYINMPNMEIQDAVFMADSLNKTLKK